MKQTQALPSETLQPVDKTATDPQVCDSVLGVRDGFLKVVSERSHWRKGREERHSGGADYTSKHLEVSHVLKGGKTMIIQHRFTDASMCQVLS